MKYKSTSYCYFCTKTKPDKEFENENGIRFDICFLCQKLDDKIRSTIGTRLHAANLKAVLAGVRKVQI